MGRFADRPAEVTDSDLPWDMTEPERAERQLERQLQELTDAPERQGEAVEALTQIARAQSLQGKIVDAERTLDRAERLLPTDAAPGPRLRLLLERGRILVLKRRPMEALPRFVEAWKLATESDEAFHAIDAAQMISIVETKKKKIEWTHRALSVVEDSKESRLQTWLGPLHCTVGAHFAELLQLPKALESYRKAEDSFAEGGDQNRARSARRAAGRTLRLMNRIPEALELQKRIETELQQSGLTDGVVYEEIAECLHSLDRNDEAEPYFRRSYEALSGEEWLRNNAPARLKRLKTLGKTK